MILKYVSLIKFLFQNRGKMNGTLTDLLNVRVPGFKIFPTKIKTKSISKDLKIKIVSDIQNLW